MKAKDKEREGGKEREDEECLLVVHVQKVII
jgi:hypothetical protein